MAPNAEPVGGACIRSGGDKISMSHWPQKHCIIHEYNIYSKININEQKLEVNGKDWNLALWTYAVHNSGASFQIKW